MTEQTPAPTRELSTQFASRLPMPKQAGHFNISADSWKVLTEAIFPSARSPEAVILALAYCKSRKLDVFKRPVHIVPIWDSKRKCEVETIWPGIGELRTTAQRTGAYAGKDDTVFGPLMEQTWKDEKKGEVTVKFHEWAQVTVYRIVQGQRVAFIGPKVYWLETYATFGGTDVPNTMWQTRSIGQHDKCAEAAALRTAFPEELGNDIAAEEVGGRRGAEVVKDAATGEVVTDDKPRRKTIDANQPTGKEPEILTGTYRGQVANVTYNRDEIEAGKAKGKTVKTRYTIEAPDGQHFHTFSESAAKLAKEVKTDGGSGEELVIDFKRTNWGLDATKVIKAAEFDMNEQERGAPSTDE